MLGDKHWMASHRGLLSIIGNISRSLPFSNKIPGVLSYGIKPLGIDIIDVPPLQMKTAAELGICQMLK